MTTKGWAAWACAAGALALAAAGGGREDEVKKEMKAIQGVWRGVSAERDGGEVPEERVREETVAFDGDRFTVRVGDEAVVEGTVKLDPSAEPKAIDAAVSKGQDEGKTLLGIYELKADEFRICLAEAGGGRPTEFSAGKPAGGRILEVFRREKAK
jgi:uncharacterized protein (TIGR03067 family)